MAEGSGADIVANDVDDACIILAAGNDQLDDNADGTYIIAGPGDDGVVTASAHTVLGGDGNDAFAIMGEGTDVAGGAGDDTFDADGHHIITPGPGADSVAGTGGAVLVQIWTCARSSLARRWWRTATTARLQWQRGTWNRRGW